MPTKKAILLDGIKKLLELDVSDEEIAKNLKEIGVTGLQAVELIEEARHPLAPKKKAESEPEEIEIETEPEPSDFEEEQIKESAEDLEEPEIETSDTRRPSLAKSQKVAGEVLAKQEKKVSPDSFAKIWEKGILTMVNQKLKRMEKIQGNLEAELHKRAAAIAKKELDKMQVLFESQRVLTLEQVDSKLESKTAQLDGMLDNKIQELKTISREIKSDLSGLQKLHKTQNTGIEEIKKELEELQETKKQLVAEMNSELLKSKSKVETFLDASQTKIKDIDKRVSQTLELESNIVETLSKNAEEKLDSASVGLQSRIEERFEERLASQKEKILEIESSLKGLKKKKKTRKKE